MKTIEESGARQIIATHGFTVPLVRYLHERGMEASAFATEFGTDEEDSAAAEQES